MRAVDALSASLPQLEDYLVSIQEVLEQHEQDINAAAAARAKEVEKQAKLAASAGGGGLGAGVGGLLDLGAAVGGAVGGAMGGVVGGGGATPATAAPVAGMRGAGEGLAAGAEMGKIGSVGGVRGVGGFGGARGAGEPVAMGGGAGAGAIGGGTGGVVGGGAGEAGAGPGGGAGGAGKCAVVMFPDEDVLDVIEKLTELQSYVYTSGYAVSEVEGGGGGAGAGEGDGDNLSQPREYCQNFMRDLGVAELLMAILENSTQIFYIQVREGGPACATAWRRFVGLFVLMRIKSASLSPLHGQRTSTRCPNHVHTRTAARACGDGRLA